MNVGNSISPFADLNKCNIDINVDVDVNVDADIDKQDRCARVPL